MPLLEFATEKCDSVYFINVPWRLQWLFLDIADNSSYKMNAMDIQVKTKNIMHSHTSAYIAVLVKRKSSQKLID